MAYVFKYSIRTGTPAATMADQVPEDVKEERNQVLLGLLERNSIRRNELLLGTVQEVLVDGPTRPAVASPADPRQPGRDFRRRATPHRSAGAIEIERATVSYIVWRVGLERGWKIIVSFLVLFLVLIFSCPPNLITRNSSVPGSTAFCGMGRTCARQASSEVSRARST